MKISNPNIFIVDCSISLFPISQNQLVDWHYKEPSKIIEVALTYGGDCDCVALWIHMSDRGKYKLNKGSYKSSHARKILCYCR